MNEAELTKVVAEIVELLKDNTQQSIFPFWFSSILDHLKNIALIMGSLVIPILIWRRDRLAGKIELAIEFIRLQLSDQMFHKNEQVFRDLAEQGKLLSTLDTDKSDKAIQDTIAVRKHLNNLEFMCTAINNGAADEKLLKNNFANTLLRNWELAEELIMAIREQPTESVTSKYYDQFEQVKDRWKQK